jgi:hypothetical protein
MTTEARYHPRYQIKIEEIAGSFNLNAGDIQVDYMRVNDVSAGGVGILSSQPLPIGMSVTMTFSAGDWAVSVEGNIAWCRRQSLPAGTAALPENYRLGVRFKPQNIDRNLIFYHASRSSVRPLH